MAFGGLYKQIIGGVPALPISTGIMGAAAMSRQTVLVNDVASDPRHIPAPGVAGVVAELAVPILVGGRVLGVLNVESRHTFSDEDADGLRVVAGQLAVAIENARLYVAAQRAAVLDERQRLARELHDSVAQQLFSATLVAQAVGPAYARDYAEGERRAAMLLGLTRAALGEMRELLTELRPLRPDFNSAPAYESPIAHLSRDGLVRALHAHVASPALAGLPVSIVSDGYEAQSPAREEALFRIAQEALHNVVKHARATRAEVRLESVGGVARLLVRDDGVGVPQGAKRRRATDVVANGLGLMTMRERAAEHGGALRIDSAPDGGTIIEADIPLNADGSA
jgi:signal transduction histidine kinase